MRSGSITGQENLRPWRLTVVVVCLVVGCSRGHGTVPVNGRVVFAGGRPPAECVVMFVPLGGLGGPLRAGKAVCRPDGTFAATTFRLGDGLVPGRYRALLRCIVAGPGQEAEAVSAVPENFDYPLVDVAPDSPGVELTIVVPPGSGGG